MKYTAVAPSPFCRKCQLEWVRSRAQSMLIVCCCLSQGSLWKEIAILTWFPPPHPRPLFLRKLQFTGSHQYQQAVQLLAVSICCNVVQCHSLFSFHLGHIRSDSGLDEKDIVHADRVFIYFHGRVALVKVTIGAKLISRVKVGLNWAAL